MWCENWEENAYLAEWPESKRLLSAMKEKKKEMKYTMPGIKDDACSPRKPSARIDEIFRTSLVKLEPESNMNAVKQLISLGDLDFALQATSSVLTLMSQGIGRAGKGGSITSYSLEMWSIRFQLMFGLQMYKQLLDEISIFEELDAPDLFFQYHSSFDPPRRGSMIPFAFRLVHAEVLAHSPLPSSAIPRVLKLEADVKEVLKNLTNRKCSQGKLTIWSKRLEATRLAKARILYLLGDFASSVQTLLGVREDEPEAKRKSEISLGLARLTLSYGDVKRAEQYIDDAKDAENYSQHIHRIFLNLSQCDNESAKVSLEEAVKDEPNNPVVVNTRAICELYSSEALRGRDTLYEKLRDSSGRVNVRMATNLRTLTELVSTTNEKKKILDEIERNSEPR